jgi:septum site-determining protein MinD
MDNNAKVFGVIALKGGVGKTTVVSNLGTALSQEFKKKVLLVDANFATPHLGLHLGMVNTAYNLQNVMSNKYPIHEAIYRHPLGFHIIPGAISSEGVSNPLALKEKIAQLKGIYDVILIDSSPSLNDEMFATMAASDELIVVSSPDYPTLSSTLHAIKVAKKKNTPIRGIVINKVRNKKFELSAKDIAKASEVDVLAVLPDNIGVLAALAEMTPVVAKSPRQDVSKEYKRLAGILIGEKYSSGIFSKIKSKLSKKEKKEVK